MSPDESEVASSVQNHGVSTSNTATATDTGGDVSRVSASQPPARQGLFIVDSTTRSGYIVPSVPSASAAKTNQGASGHDNDAAAPEVDMGNAVRDERQESSGASGCRDSSSNGDDDNTPKLHWPRSPTDNGRSFSMPTRDGTKQVTRKHRLLLPELQNQR